MEPVLELLLTLLVELSSDYEMIDIGRYSDIHEDLGMTQMQFIDLVHKLEDELGITLPHPKKLFARLNTIEDLVILCEAKLLEIDENHPLLGN